MDKKNKIWLHVAFWLFFSIIPRLISPPAFHIDIFFISFLLIDVITFYIFYFFIIPKYFDKDSKAGIILISVFLILAIVVVRMGLSKYFSMFDNRIMEQLTRNPSLFLLKELINTFLFVVYPLLLTFTIRYFSVQKLKSELETQNKESELSLLRSQINPHFFFNTLNNIYSLVYSGSPHAHISIMKLSDLMRYSLYKTNTEKVSLEAEISYLIDYIDLELLRMKNKDYLDKEISPVAPDLEIAPLILLPFIENSFKHCDKNAPSPGIVIKIKLNKSKLHLSVINKIDLHKEKEAVDEGGIGLSNVKKRLELLYPEKHDLLIFNKDDQFFVDLKIELK